MKSAPIPVGTGKIRIDHGIYPVPAPATLEILKNVPIEQSDIRFELTTPTGGSDCIGACGRILRYSINESEVNWVWCWDKKTFKKIILMCFVSSLGSNYHIVREGVC
ncbi:hypothetical protein GCM10020331_095790 [Ectobacillus funiculus]